MFEVTLTACHVGSKGTVPHDHHTASTSYRAYGRHAINRPLRAGLQPCCSASRLLDSSRREPAHDDGCPLRLSSPSLDVTNPAARNAVLVIC